MTPQGSTLFGHLQTLPLQVCPAGQQVALQLVWPTGQSGKQPLLVQTWPAGQQVPLQKTPPFGQTQWPLVQISPTGQQVPPQATRPPGQVHLPFTHDWPAGQQVPLQGGWLFDGQTQRPLRQLWPAGQQAVPVALTQVVVPVGQAHLPLVQMPLQQTLLARQGRPAGWQVSLVVPASALAAPKPATAKRPARPPPTRVFRAWRRDRPLPTLRARSSNLPLFKAAALIEE
jgi:hypothetical protein